MTPAGPPNGRLAVFPGSFDPLTNGHVDIILRSTHLFERVLVAVLVNAEKQPLFTADERGDGARGISRVLERRRRFVRQAAVEMRQTRRASAIIRGLRAVSDFSTSFRWRS